MYVLLFCVELLVLSLTKHPTTSHCSPDLTKYASHVYVLVRKGELRASRIMAKRLENHPKCTILWNTEATECLGDGDLLNALSIVNNKTKETSKLEVNGLFYAIGELLY